jgi:tetratricopeptide (TPR) repeat protein
MRRCAAFLGFLLLLCPGAGLTHPSTAERIEILTRRIETQPADPRHYLARGAVYSEEGRYELALADFAKAEALGAPQLVGYELAVLHRRKGNLATARRHLDAFLGRFPNHAPALEERARLLSDLGQNAAAVATFEKLFALTQRPNPGSYISAARLLAAQGEGGAAHAVALLDTGIERLGVIPQLQHVAIELELSRGEEQKALDRLESLRPILGEAPEWKVEMSELLIRMKRSAEAQQLLADASRQLDTLRETPARRELARRITTIKAAIESLVDG